MLDKRLAFAVKDSSSCARWVIRFMREEGRFAKPPAQLDKALRIYSHRGDQEGLGRTHYERGAVLHLHGQYSASRAELQSAVRVLTQCLGADHAALWEPLHDLGWVSDGEGKHGRCRNTQ